jgi:hypothetical protein
MDLSADEALCVGLVRKHGVDPKKLEKPLDQSANQAAALIAECERTGVLPAALAKAFLSDIINSGAVAHAIERNQRTLQIPPLQAPVDNRGDGEGKAPKHFIGDFYLGGGNGVQSRLTAIEARKIKAVANLEKISKVSHDRFPGVPEGIASGVKNTGRQHAEAFDNLDPSVMAKAAAGVQDAKSSAPGNGDAKTAQPKPTAHPELADVGRPEFMMVALLKDAASQKSHLGTFLVEVVSAINGAVAKRVPLKSVERAVAKVFEKRGCRFDQLTDVARDRTV